MPLLRAAAASARAWLFEHALPLWWERGYDREARCFHERLTLDGAPVMAEPRRVRVQARQTIVYARAARLGWQGPWRDAVEAGAAVLIQRCLRPNGGTHHLLAPGGGVLDDRRDLYDSAFVILALAEAAQALENSELATAAANLADWAWDYWAHPEGGLDEGEVCPAPPRRQNPHMHLFEAMLALHEATGEEAHLEQASALAALFQRRLFDPQYGALPEYFDDSWRPMSDLFGRITEPGHQFEWSWLLLRWGAAAGGGLHEEAERLRLHGETHGVGESGAVCDEVLIDGRPHKTTSRLWPNTERLKANLARYRRTGDPAAQQAALQANGVLNAFCATPTPGLWYDLRTPSGEFVSEPARASSFYHIIFALDELIQTADALN